MSSRLEVSDLSVGYETVVLSDGNAGLRQKSKRRFFPVLQSLSFDLVFDGRPVAILGANGVGKTTLLRAIAGVMPAAGVIRWDNSRLDTLSQRNRTFCGVTLVPQDDGIFPSLTVHQHFQLLGLRAVRPSNIRDLLAARLAPDGSIPMSMAGFVERNPRAGQLSGGERRLLSLIRLLFRKWSLILLDEPATGLSSDSLAILSEIVRLTDPACVIQTAQHSQAEMLSKSGARLFELTCGSLRSLE